MSFNTIFNKDYNKLEQATLQIAKEKYPEFYDPKKIKKLGGGDYGYAGFIGLLDLANVYITLLVSLPVFENLSDAKEGLVHSTFPMTHETYLFDLNQEMRSPKKMIHFLANRLEDIRKSAPSSLIVMPEQLKQLVELVKDVSQSQIPIDVVQEMLSTGSKAHQKLFDLTVSKLRTEKERLTQKNWQKAKSSLSQFHLIQFIKQLFKNIVFTWDTRRLIHHLEKRKELLHNQKVCRLGYTGGFDHIRHSNQTFGFSDSAAQRAI